MEFNKLYFPILLPKGESDRRKKIKKKFPDEDRKKIRKLHKQGLFRLDGPFPLLVFSWNVWIVDSLK